MEFWIKDPFCDQAIACCDIQNNVGFSGNGRDHDPATNVTHDNILKIDPQYRDDINTKIRIKTRDCSASPTSRFNRPVVHDNLQQISDLDNGIGTVLKPSLLLQRSPSPVRRSPSPFHERLVVQTTKATQLRCKETKENKRVQRAPKPSIPRSPSPFHERLAVQTTKATQFRCEDTKENKRVQRAPKPSIPRSPSPFHERLAIQTTKATKFRFETNESKRNKLQKPVLPRSPSPLHERLAIHATKATQFRYEETKEIRSSSNKPMKDHMQFYCASSNSMSSNDSELTPLVVTSNDDSSLLTFSSNSESEELSYMKEQQKVRKVSLRIDTQSRPRSVNHFDRLSATNTKAMERRRQLEKEIYEQKLANRFGNYGREAFYRYPPKSPKMSSKLTASSRNSSAPPRNSTCDTPRTRNFVHSSYVAKTKTLTPSYKHKQLGFFQRKESFPKSSPTNAELDSLFNRLAKQDTIASSRKTVLTGLRPVILTEYEKKELIEKDRIEMERKKVRTSPRFFDVLSKDMTMSRLYKEYDEAQRVSAKDERLS
jgi:hypothetical protein